MKPKNEWEYIIMWSVLSAAADSLSSLYILQVSKGQWLFNGRPCGEFICQSTL